MQVQNKKNPHLIPRFYLVSERRLMLGKASWSHESWLHSSWEGVCWGEETWFQCGTWLMCKSEHTCRERCLHRDWLVWTVFMYECHTTSIAHVHFSCVFWLMCCDNLPFSLSDKSYLPLLFWFMACFSESPHSNLTFLVLIFRALGSSKTACLLLSFFSAPFSVSVIPAFNLPLIHTSYRQISPASVLPLLCALTSWTQPPAVMNTGKTPSKKYLKGAVTNCNWWMIIY